MPDATTLLNFRCLLVTNDLTSALFDESNAHLAEQGLRMRAVIVANATVMATPSSMENEERQR